VGLLRLGQRTRGERRPKALSSMKGRGRGKKKGRFPGPSVRSALDLGAEASVKIFRSGGGTLKTPKRGEGPIGKSPLVPGGIRAWPPTRSLDVYAWRAQKEDSSGKKLLNKEDKNSVELTGGDLPWEN